MMGQVAGTAISGAALNLASELYEIADHLTLGANSNDKPEDLIERLDGALELLSDVQAKYTELSTELFELHVKYGHIA